MRAALGEAAVAPAALSGRQWGPRLWKVASSALLAQTAAHVFESHPSSGQLGRVSALELAEEGDTLSVKGLALFQASLGPRPLSPALFAALPGFSAQLSIPLSFPPVGWSSARILFLDQTFLLWVLYDWRGHVGLHTLI